MKQQCDITSACTFFIELARFVQARVQTSYQSNKVSGSSTGCDKVPRNAEKRHDILICRVRDSAEWTGWSHATVLLVCPLAPRLNVLQHGIRSRTFFSLSLCDSFVLCCVCVSLVSLFYHGWAVCEDIEIPLSFFELLHSIPLQKTNPNPGLDSAFFPVHYIHFSHCVPCTTRHSITQSRGEEAI